MSEKMNEMLVSINKELIFLANEVEDAIYRSIKALEKQDKDLALEVKKTDKKINIHEVEIEKMILELMALQQPVAVDLRFIVVALKINNDLERIGDHAKSIAKTAIKLCGEPYIKQLELIPKLAKVVRGMLHDAVQSFINQNSELARDVTDRDPEADELYDKIYDTILEELKTQPEKARQGFELINVGQHLERIADLATNIGEDVVFMKEAKIIRYGLEE